MAGFKKFGTLPLYGIYSLFRHQKNLSAYITRGGWSMACHRQLPTNSLVICISFTLIKTESSLLYFVSFSHFCISLSTKSRAPLFLSARPLLLLETALEFLPMAGEASSFMFPSPQFAEAKAIELAVNWVIDSGLSLIVVGLLMR